MPRSKNHVDRALNPWKPRPSKAPPLQKAAPPPISKSPPPPPKAQLPLPRARPSQAAPLSGAQSPTVMPPSSTPPLSPAIAASESHDIAKCLEEAETIYKEALVLYLRSKCRQSILDLTRAATQAEHHHIITQISEMQQATFMNSNSEFFKICIIDDSPVGYIGLIGERKNEITLCVIPEKSNLGIGSYMLSRFQKLNKKTRLCYQSVPVCVVNRRIILPWLRRRRGIAPQCRLRLTSRRFPASHGNAMRCRRQLADCSLGRIVPKGKRMNHAPRRWLCRITRETNHPRRRTTACRSYVP